MAELKDRWPRRLYRRLSRSRSASAQSGSRLPFGSFGAVAAAASDEQDDFADLKSKRGAVAGASSSSGRVRDAGAADEDFFHFDCPEGGGDKATAEMQAYTKGHRRLNSAYGFDLLYAPELTPQVVAETLARWSSGGGWPSWAFENHDAPRAVSRWCAPEDRTRFARMKAALLAALRGNIILYQGEELGLEQDDIPFELLRDPEAIANWPLTLSRDGARTPMPWRNAPLGGFTTGTPWLPLSAANLARAAEGQERDETSLLALTRQLLAIRKAYPALRLGSLGECVAEGGLLSFVRSAGKARVRCLFNLSREPVRLPAAVAGTPIIAINGAAADRLPGYAALYVAG